MQFPSSDDLQTMEALDLMGLLNGVLVESEGIKERTKALNSLRIEKRQRLADAKVAVLRNKQDVDAQATLIQAQATLDVLKIELENAKSVADACKLQSSILQTTINTQVRLAR